MPQIIISYDTTPEDMLEILEEVFNNVGKEYKTDECDGEITIEY